MKLATYRDGSRDGQLVVVSRDGVSAHYANGIASRLQQALDDWNFIAPQLQDLYETLNVGKARHAFEFDPQLCMAPLPRASQWVAAQAYRADGPALAQGNAGDLLGARDAVRCASEDDGIDFGAGLAVITGDVELGASPEQALEGVRLIALVNDWALREQPGALAPATAFSPLAVTPDELGAAWDGGRVHLTLQTAWNGKTVGACETGPEMVHHFGQLIAALAATRRVRGGSIVGSGPVRNADASRGYACIADKRAAEAAEQGAAKTAYLRFGDRVRIEMKGRDGLSVCGAIEQEVASL